MGEQLVSSIASVLMAMIGLAIIATLVSNKAQTASVLTAGGNAFGGILNAATNPYSGNQSGFGFGGF